MPAAAPGQLPFPFARAAPPSPVAAEALGRLAAPAFRTRLALGGRRVVVSFSRGRDGAAVRLEAQHDAPGAWAIALDLRLRPLVLATTQSDSPRPLHWALSPRGPGADPGEFFAYALGWAARKLAGETRDRARLRAAEAGVRPALREAAAALAGALDPALRGAAVRFAPRTRSRVAGALAPSRDPRGWLRQASRAHPGLVLLGLALVDVEETEDAGVALLHDLASGRRLGPALDAAVEGWAAALPAWAEPSDLRARAERGAFAAAAALAGGDRTRMLAAQRLLVRRAGYWCEPAALLLPPPLRFAPEDLPAAPRENAAWFRVMKVPGVTVEGRPAPADRALAEAFSAFASRHAVALARPPRGIGMGPWLAELVEGLRAAGRTPSRATDPARLVDAADVAELRRRLAVPPPRLVRLAPGPDPARARPRVPVAAEPAADGLARPEPGTAAGAPARPAAESPTISPRRFEPWVTERASVFQITTLRELREEGVRMSNCVADYRELVRRGEVVVLSARVAGRPITIAVRPWLKRWRLAEWKGYANRRLTPAEVALLAPWLDANGIDGARR